ncbi:6240_t:CDS:2 [Acaulospora colombiana]|uniref:6240_t:CDS:1 n=1 Tax=Acaulospora colombiana TaxID=27376 RepID=A0ACA9KEV9_9GLOM|nr:6240_t:CDS:2 [Acaulospora colombiana]
MPPMHNKKLKTYQRKRRHGIPSGPSQRHSSTKPSQLLSRRLKSSGVSETSSNTGQESDSDVIVKRRSVLRRDGKFNISLAVADVIDYGLKEGARPELIFLIVIFVNLFSGKKSVSTGHHFSSSLNHFYDCLMEGGLTRGERVNYLDDRRLARDFKLGIVTLLCRPEDRSKKKLSIDKITCAIPNLIKKVKVYRPKYLCFIGRPRKVKWGLQSTKLTWNEERHPNYTRIFVTMPTSERAEEYSKEDRVNSFRELNRLLFEEEVPQVGEAGGDTSHEDEESDIDLLSEHSNTLNVYDHSLFDRVSFSRSSNNPAGCDVQKKLARRDQCDRIEKEIVGMIEELQCDMEVNFHEDQDQCTPSFRYNGHPHLPGGNFMKVPSQNDSGITDACDEYSAVTPSSRVYSWICQVHGEMNGVEDRGNNGPDFTPPKSFKAIRW